MFRRYLETKTDEYIRECLEGLIDEVLLKTLFNYRLKRLV
jgi:hypothetical protein